MGLMLLKLNLGTAMAMPNAMAGHHLVQTSLSTVHQDTAVPELPKDRHFAVSAPALVVAGTECHGHTANPTDKQATDNALSLADTDKPCKSNAQCQDCCSVGLIHWTALALHPATFYRPVPEPHGWQSANLPTVLRPPIN
jgi:hypothetical protein